MDHGRASKYTHSMLDNVFIPIIARSENEYGSLNDLIFALAIKQIATNALE